MANLKLSYVAPIKTVKLFIILKKNISNLFFGYRKTEQTQLGLCKIPLHSHTYWEATLSIWAQT
jgi:hypothetical protein